MPRRRTRLSLTSSPGVCSSLLVLWQILSFSALLVVCPSSRSRGPSLRRLRSPETLLPRTLARRLFLSRFTFPVLRPRLCHPSGRSRSRSSTRTEALGVRRSYPGPGPRRGAPEVTVGRAFAPPVLMSSGRAGLEFQRSRHTGQAWASRSWPSRAAVRRRGLGRAPPPLP